MSTVDIRNAAILKDTPSTLCVVGDDSLSPVHNKATQSTIHVVGDDFLSTVRNKATRLRIRLVGGFIGVWLLFGQVGLHNGEQRPTRMPNVLYPTATSLIASKAFN